MAFDDDDTPLTVGGPSSAGGGNDHNGDGGGAEEALEDEMPDFKLFSAMLNKKGVSSKSIRKGEKDFESHGTKAQDGALENSRQAMSEVLDYTRIHKKEGWTRAWYFPERWEGEPDRGDADDGLRLRDRVVVVEHNKGSWNKACGRVVPAAKDPIAGARMWLLPEEALSLVERGTIDLWWPDRELGELLPKDGEAAAAERQGFGPDDYDVGVPLSLEAAYSLLIGEEGERGRISLSKYQVYAHLKRSGYYILRAPPGASPTPAPSAESLPGQSLWQRLFALISWDRRPPPSLPWGPLVRPGLYRAYLPIYQQLAILERHKPSIEPAPRQNPRYEPEEPFRVFYYVWKAGGAPFTKTNPPLPDFRIAVTDTSNSGVPTLGQIDALLQSSAPYEPPLERMRRPGLGNMYQRLKHGHRNILVAVVDAGLVNFIRFGEGAFGEEKLHERFDVAPATRGGKRGGGRGGGRGRGGGGRGKRGRR